VGRSQEPFTLGVLAKVSENVVKMSFYSSDVWLDIHFFLWGQ
jgi:hypothetical protein